MASMPGTERISSRFEIASAVSIIGITAMCSPAQARLSARRIEAITGPQLRAPSGAYRTDRTTASACSRVLTIGTTTPWAPASSDLPMTPGSFHGTRTIGLPPLSSIAWIIAAEVW
jgi:hypothetical protein